MSAESCNYNYVVDQHENKKANVSPNTVTIIGMALSSCVNEIGFIHMQIKLIFIWMVVHQASLG